MNKKKYKRKQPINTTGRKILQHKEDAKMRFSHFLWLGIIILTGILIYSNSFECTFHFDDKGSIVDNVIIRDLSDIKTIWNYSQTRFMAILSFAINYHFGELNVWGYHLANLVIHLANACLVYWFALLIFSSRTFSNLQISRDKNMVAFFTALLFVTHPLATQSVTYIVQRMASLAAMFYLFSIVLYLQARLSQKANFGKYLLFAGALVFALLAMLTKENAFTLPFAIMLIEFFFFQSKLQSFNFKTSKIFIPIIAFLCGIGIIAFTFSSNIFKSIAPNFVNDQILTPLNYFYTQLNVIPKYIQQLFLPINLNLDHDFPISNSLFEAGTLMSLLILAALLAFAIFLFKKHKLISFGIFWFFITLAVESSFVPINDVMFEHRTYLPSFGFFLILSYGLYILLWKKYKSVAISIFMIIAVANSILTFQRNKVWKDELTLWSDVITKSPNKARGYVHRGHEYRKRKQNEKALADYNVALKISPDYYSTAYYNRGNVLWSLNRLESAVADFTRAIEIKSKYAQAYLNRGICYKNLQQADKAMADYDAAIQIDSNYMLAYYNRGNGFLSLGQNQDALQDYNNVVRLDPNNKLAIYNRGIAQERLGNLDQAIIEYQNTYKIDPSYKNAFFNCGRAYHKLEEWDKAVQELNQAILLDPTFIKAINARGFAFINLGSWDKAHADYSKVLEIDPKNATATANLQYILTKSKGNKNNG